MKYLMYVILLIFFLFHWFLILILRYWIDLIFFFFTLKLTKKQKDGTKRAGYLQITLFGYTVIAIYT